MRKLALRLVMLFAAVMVGVWPAYASFSQHSVPAETHFLSMASHHMDGQRGAHQSLDAGDRCHEAASEQSQPAASSAPGHCSSWLMACGVGIAATLPTGVEIRSRVHVAVSHRLEPEDISVAHSVSPALRPPCHSS